MKTGTIVTFPPSRSAIAPWKGSLPSRSPTTDVLDSISGSSNSTRPTEWFCFYPLSTLILIYFGRSTDNFVTLTPYPTFSCQVPMFWPWSPMSLPKSPMFSNGSPMFCAAVPTFPNVLPELSSDVPNSSALPRHLDVPDEVMFILLPDAPAPM